MDEFVKMDIFFFITTFCIVLLTTMIALVIWKLLRILKHVEHLAEVAGKEAENLREDAAYLRGRLLGALEAMFSFIPRRRRKSESSDEK